MRVGNAMVNRAAGGSHRREVDVGRPVEACGLDPALDEEPGRAASTASHSSQSWSYQNPGGLACPVETMPSMRTPGEARSVSTCSSAASRKG
jgi:hypothetical protein